VPLSALPHRSQQPFCLLTQYMILKLCYWGCWRVMTLLFCWWLWSLMSDWFLERLTDVFTYLLLYITGMSFAAGMLGKLFTLSLAV